MINYLKFCKKLNLVPQKASSLRKYKKNLQLKYSDKEHITEALAVDYSLRKSINNEKSNNNDC